MFSGPQRPRLDDAVRTITLRNQKIRWVKPVTSAASEKRDDLGRNDHGHSSVCSYAILDFIRVDSCDEWAN